MKLFCLTYAGGNKYSYRYMEPYLDDSIDIITLELPGRGGRIMEPLVDKMDVLVDDLYNQLKRYKLSNYMFYGHSMGGILGDLLIKKLRENSKPLPFYFFVTGCSSPKKKYLRKKLHKLNDVDFRESIKKLGGMPDEIMKNDDLMDYVTPILRSDIKALETNVYKELPKYHVPITVIVGDDENVEDDDLMCWGEETSANFESIKLPGGHFFVQDNVEYITGFINKLLVKDTQVTQ